MWIDEYISMFMSTINHVDEGGVPEELLLSHARRRSIQPGVVSQLKTIAVSKRFFKNHTQRNDNPVGIATNLEIPTSANRILPAVRKPGETCETYTRDPLYCYLHIMRHGLLQVARCLSG